MPILRVILADFNEMTLVIWSTLMVYLLQVRLFITTLLNDHYECFYLQHSEDDERMIQEFYPKSCSSIDCFDCFWILQP